MISREFGRNFRIYFIVSFIFLGLASFSRISLTELFNVVDPEYEALTHPERFKLTLVMLVIGSALISLFSSLLDIFVVKRILRRSSLGVAIGVGFLAQIIVMLLIFVFMIGFYYRAFTSLTGIPAKPPHNIDVMFMLVHLSIGIALAKFFIEIDRKLGPGNLWKVLTGRFFRPHEEERIFMFIDMKGATTIAERIGHFEFSKLLQDCFHDFTVVDKHRAEIYQYVGDEVVISWSPKNAFKNNNFLNAYFSFIATLEEKSAYYIEKYGVHPNFKAGANMGLVVSTEVGDIKREITYHGDTLNTASRIQDQCNAFDVRMLISAKLYEQVQDKSDFLFEGVGTTLLKGKEEHIELYSVTKKA